MKHRPMVEKKNIGKYFLLHNKITKVQLSGSKNTKMNKRKGINSESSTKITFKAAIMAINVMFCDKVSFFLNMFILRILHFFQKK